MTERNDRWRTTAFAAMVIAAAAVAVAAIAVAVNYQRINDIVEARTDGRIAACKTQQTFANAHNGLVQRGKDRLSQTFNPPGVERPAAIQKQVDDYLAAQFAQDDKNFVRVPKCDPASVDRAYSNLGSK